MDIEVKRFAELSKEELELWQRWHLSNPNFSNPFLSPDFIRMVSEIDQWTKVLVVRDSLGPAGFLAFDEPVSRVGIPPLWPGSDYQAMVHRPGFSIDRVTFLEGAKLDILYLDHVPTHNVLFSGFQVLSSEPSYRIDFTKFSGHYEAILPKKVQANLKTRRRAMRDQFGERIQFLNKSENPAAIDRLLAWKDTQFRETGVLQAYLRGNLKEYNQIFHWLPKFYLHLTRSRSLEVGGVLYALQVVDGDPLALDFILAGSKTAHSWLKGYDNRYKSIGAGTHLHCLISQVMKEQNKIEVYDLGYGTEDYKRRLSNDVTYVAPLVLVRGSGREESLLSAQLFGALSSRCEHDLTDRAKEELRKLICAGLGK